jgi:predicted metal-binding membrane protein
MLSPLARISALPRRDAIAISVSLAGIVALSWWYLFDLSASMAEPMAGAMPGGEGMAAMAVPVWNFAYFAAMFLMWSIMMIGMMLPSVTPTVLIYSLVAKKAAGQGSPVAPTSAFVSGYVLVWIGFSLLATTSQYLLDQASLLTGMMASNSDVLGGSLLLVAGAWQFAPLKNQCLQHCRSPFDFISRNWQRGKFGAARMGIKHGIICLGCCWAIMTLLFVGGVMNLLWIAVMSLFVLLEKILPGAERTGKLAGALLIGAGLIVLAL